MQTFLPYPDFHESAACLDIRRLGKQRVEVMQILCTITGLSDGWSNHPAVRMWRPFPQALASYGLAICDQWRTHAYQDTCGDWLDQWLDLHGLSWTDSMLPPWLGTPAFHASHRSNLLRKAPSHYTQFGWNEPADLPYVWPLS